MEASDGFELTPLADPLRSDVPDSKRAMVLMTGEEQYRAWGELLYSVTTGKKGFDRVFGQPLFDYLSRAARASEALFDAAMVSIHGHETPAMIAAYEFLTASEPWPILGGGNASVFDGDFTGQLARPCAAFLFDLPNVVAQGRREPIRSCRAGRSSARPSAGSLRSVPAAEPTPI